MSIENMLSLQNKWNITHAKTPENKIYKGTFEVVKNNKILLGKWEIMDEDNQVEYYSGIGLPFQDFIIFSRLKGNINQTDKSNLGNIVHYSPIRQTGSMSAIWNEPSIGNDIGSGIAVGGKPEVLIGNYRVTYFYPTGINPECLDLLISIANKDSNIYKLEWRKEKQVRLIGTGIEIQGELAVAYNNSGIESQLVVYKIHSEDDHLCLHGHWSSTDSDVLGAEILIN